VIEEAEMAAYVIAHVDVTDPGKYDEYKKAAYDSVYKYGGKYLVRGPKPELLEGSWDLKRLVLLEFPSVERAREWWNSPEYAAAKSKRKGAASGQFVLLEGI
jgi:uncharacterized protein (DUF1330 family)